MTTFFHGMPGGQALLLTGLASVAMSAMAWWRDCIIESDMGMHTEVGVGWGRRHGPRAAKLLREGIRTVTSRYVMYASVPRRFLPPAPSIILHADDDVKCLFCRPA